MISFERPSGLPRFSDPATSRTDRPAARPLPDIRNVDSVLGLLEYRALDYNGQVFIVPPISYRDGVTLQAMQVRLAALQEQPADIESTSDYADLLRDIVAVCGRLVVPCGWRRRVRWLLRNPLRKATEQELGAVMDFLLLCRTTARVRLSVVPAPHRVRT